MSDTTSPARQARVIDQYDGPDTTDEMEKWAKWLAESTGMIPDRFSGSAANVFAAMVQARGLRITIMSAMHDLYYDDGQVAMKASLIQLLVLRAGHKVIVHRADREAAAIEIERCDGLAGGTVTWTIGEATVAGLVANPYWQDYPEDCLYARAIARAARRFASDATGGVVYVPEEVRSGYADGGDADAPLADRTVSEPVQALLDGLDELPHRQVRERWDAAMSLGLLNAYAADGPDSTVVTLSAVLRARLEATMPAPRQRAASPISPPPAGAESLASCGQCTTESVLLTGNHRDGCPQHVADLNPPPAVPEVAAIAEPARRRRRRRGGKGRTSRVQSS